MIKLEPLHPNTKIQGTDIKTQIMPLYLAGKSMQEIADKFSMDIQTLSVGINMYIQKEKWKIQRERIKNIKSEDLYNLLKQGISYKEIVRLYNVSITTVETKLNNYFEEHGIEKTKHQKKKYAEKVDVEKLIHDFKNGYTLQQLANLNNVSVNTVVTNLRKELSREEIKAIYAKIRTKKYVSQEKVYEIVDLYEKGLSKTEISSKLGYSTIVIGNLLSTEYSKMGREVPKRINKGIFLEKMRTKAYSREEIIEEAKKMNRIIPKELLDEYFGKEELDIGKVRKFVIEQFSDKKVSEQEKKLMFKSFNVAKILKEHNYDLKHQALALVYSLSEVTKTALEDIAEVLDNNEEMVSALKVIMGDEYKEKDYLEELKKCEMAKNVKLAIMLEELKEHNLNGKKIDKNEYREYQKMAFDTQLEEQYNLALMENENLFKGSDR